ncbi:hypothetical protein [Flammeovirga sp. SJP92]|uniref:hypothetical protein n=1 Tax=Flammeovirga sp. SJP92 TaxID=1775430 RepID=UPI0012FBB2F8|nr:hypothetical protein [Flammeovirga sp. SJP92]
MNKLREKLGVPTIKENMVMMDEMTWSINNRNSKDGSFHAKKIIMYDRNCNSCSWEESDMFRKKINDSTYVQLNLHSVLNNDKVDFNRTKPLLFKVDIRALKVSVKGEIDNMLFGSDTSKRSIDYPSKIITMEQADSVLLSWNLKRL